MSSIRISGAYATKFSMPQGY
eukprot:SAG31_NODE_12640_length_927_cov_4.334541_1_plen_20_part_01